MASSRLEPHWTIGPAAAIIVAALGAGLVLTRPKPAPALAERAPQPVERAPALQIDPAPTGAILPHPFGELAAPTPPKVAPQATGLAPDELARFTTAANFYRKGAFPQGDAAEAAVTDPIARAGLDWIALRVGPTPARLDAFAKAHPDWPVADWMRSVREGWLFSAKPTPAETLATLGDAPPLTPQGRIALARADLALGKRDEALAIVRASWRNGDLDAASETAVLREFGAALTRDDHRARASRLAYSGRPAAAWRAAALAGKDVVALINARNEAARGPLSARASTAVPEALRSDPGYIFAHVQDARRSGRFDEAIGWLKLAPSDPEKLVDPDDWWSERRMVARALIDRGQYEKAYTLCAEAVTASSPARVDAAFHAGWIALRFLNDPARAAPRFAAAAEAAETPISIARANYWRGRAAKALGRADNAQGYYSKAAAYPIAYYGQLAARELGADEVTPRRPAAAATGDARAEATRVIEIYLAAGLEDFATPVAYAAAQTWNDGAQLAALADLLNAKASAATNVTYGKLATIRGFPLDAVAFPTFGLPNYQPLPGSAGQAEVLAVARQESEFLPRAASGAGAKGLMQIMPFTAADTARKVGVPYNYARLVSDPSYNLQLGAAFLGQLIAGEGGSLALAAAAYNAGAGRVAQWLNAYGDPRNGADPVDWVERIPFDETRDYVMRVLENYGVYQARLAEAPKSAHGRSAGAALSTDKLHRSGAVPAAGQWRHRGSRARVAEGAFAPCGGSRARLPRSRRFFNRSPRRFAPMAARARAFCSGSNARASLARAFSTISPAARARRNCLSRAVPTRSGRMGSRFGTTCGPTASARWSGPRSCSSTAPIPASAPIRRSGASRTSGCAGSASIPTSRGRRAGGRRGRRRCCCSAASSPAGRRGRACWSRCGRASSPPCPTRACCLSARGRRSSPCANSPGSPRRRPTSRSRASCPRPRSRASGRGRAFSRCRA